MTLVAGPSCAGKSTYIAQHMQEGDIRLDIDRLSDAFSGRTDGWKPEQTRRFLSDAYNAVFELARNCGHTVWVEAWAPHRHERQGYDRVIVLETPLEVIRERSITRHPDPAMRAEEMRTVDQWWATYERDDRDEVVV